MFRDPNAVDALLHEIASVTHKAMSDVVETWNRKACGPICSLPIELLAQAFSWLDLPDRVKVTGVSRYIRSVALGQPSLWTQITLDPTTPHLPDTLALVLERSGRATLDVDMYAWSEDATAQLASHVRRMRTLIIRQTFSTAWIFEQPAPVLEVLQIPTVARGILDQTSLHTVLPSPTWAPLLRRLELPSTFVLPNKNSSGSFDRVTYFSAHITADGDADTDARRLFEVFPSLEILELFFSTDTSLHNMPNTRIPRTLVDLRLYSHGDGHNIAAFIALCHGHAFKHVHLVCRRAQLGTAAVEHVRSVASGQWHFEFNNNRGRGTFKLDDGAVYEIECDQLGLELKDLRAAFDSLGSIVMPSYLLSEQLVEAFHLPALHSITLQGSFLRRAGWGDSSSGRLCVPKLQTLRIEPWQYEWEDGVTEMQDCSQYTEGLVRRLTVEDGSALARIPRFVLSKVGREYVGAECWAWIYSYASFVYVEDEMVWQQTDK